MAAGHNNTAMRFPPNRSEEHTSELQSLRHLVCRLLLEKKNKPNNTALGATTRPGLAETPRPARASHGPGGGGPWRGPRRGARDWGILLIFFFLRAGPPPKPPPFPPPPPSQI